MVSDEGGSRAYLMAEYLDRLPFEVDPFEDLLVKGRLDQAEFEEVDDYRLQELKVGLV